MEQRIKTGDIVQHFKREMVAREPGNESAYLYEVISIDGIDTVTDSRVVVYRALMALEPSLSVRMKTSCRKSTTSNIRTFIRNTGLNLCDTRRLKALR